MKDTVPRPCGYVLNQMLKAVCDRAAEAGRVCLCVCVAKMGTERARFRSSTCLCLPFELRCRGAECEGEKHAPESEPDT